MTTFAANQTIFALEMDRSAGKPLNIFQIVGWSASALGNVPLTAFFGHFFAEDEVDNETVTPVIINNVNYYFSPLPPAGARASSPSGELVLMPFGSGEVTLADILNHASARASGMWIKNSQALAAPGFA